MTYLRRIRERERSSLLRSLIGIVLFFALVCDGKQFPLAARTARRSSSRTSKGQTTAAWVDGVKNGIASAGAAGCVKTCLQPIDAIKTIQQYHQSAGKTSLSLLGACREIVSRPGGFLNFYSGLGVTVFGAMPGVALYFGVYSYCKKFFARTEFGSNNPTLSIALSAAVGNSVASFSRVPYETIKQQLQTNAYDSTWQAFSAIAKSDKWFSMLFPKGGVAIQMIRDVPYAIVTLLMYETLQQRFRNKDSTKATDFVVGGVSGGIGSWVTNPMDVIKTRLQTSSADYGGSVIRCTSTVWSEGGAAAFLRGSVPRLMHKVPANAFFFLFYELFRKILRVSDSTGDSR